MHDDLPPDLPRLEAIETYLALTLQRVREKKADLQRRQQERQQGERAQPPVPDWLIEQALSRDTPPVYVHVGGCHMAGKRSKGVPRDAALRALVDGVPACTHCRPDSEQGYLEG
ncbi:DUF6233 domain-containing protein [Streptomyces sp. NBC_01483]|uniref:DUF6233 domain-containing protein n=1 Tax=Streptomyces sp. NBC_01483 TaxID=2903883 RepID=UPI002E31CE83|nr:DUF6233 domain-containing protein [Streptomyces sp. NBC_01483]